MKEKQMGGRKRDLMLKDNIPAGGRGTQTFLFLTTDNLTTAEYILL